MKRIGVRSDFIMYHKVQVTAVRKMKNCAHLFLLFFLILLTTSLALVHATKNSMRQRTAATSATSRAGRNVATTSITTKRGRERGASRRGVCLFMALDEKEQEITDLNLDQMFDVFEAADKAIPSQETDDAKNTVLQTKTET